MTYVAKAWKLNDTVKPDDINKIEQALAAGQAETVKTEYYSSTAQQAIYPVMSRQSTDGYNQIMKSDGLAYASRNGTTEVMGTAILLLGNAIKEGEEGNRRGTFRVYGNDEFFCQIYDAGNLTGNRNLYVPDKSGAIALTSDCMVSETIYAASFSNSNGYVDVSVSEGYKTRTLQLTPITTAGTTAYLMQMAIEELNASAGTFRIRGISTDSGKPVAFNVCYKKS